MEKKLSFLTVNRLRDEEPLHKAAKITTQFFAEILNREKSKMNIHRHLHQSLFWGLWKIVKDSVTQFMLVTDVGQIYFINSRIGTTKVAEEALVNMLQTGLSDTKLESEDSSFWSCYNVLT